MLQVYQNLDKIDKKAIYDTVSIPEKCTCCLPEHDTRRYRELDDGTEVSKRGRGEPGPRVRAATEEDEGKLAEHGDPHGDDHGSHDPRQAELELDGHEP